MGLTVEEAVRLPSLKGKFLPVGGSAGMDRPVIRVVAGDALKEPGRMTGGEFILAVRDIFPSDPAQHIPLLEELADRGAAAVAVKTGRAGDLPVSAISTAERCGLPLLQLSPRAQFERILLEITAHLNEGQTRLMEQAEAYHREIAEALLAGSSVDEMLRDLGTRLHCPLICVSWDFEVLGLYTPYSGPPSVGQAVEALEKYLADGSQNVDPFTLPGYLAVPCVARSRPLGYLLLAGERPVSGLHLHMVNQLVVFLTLRLLDRLETRQKELSALLDDLLYHRALSSESLHERLTTVGLKGPGRFRAVTVALDEPPDDTAETLKRLRFHGYNVRRILGDALLILKPAEVILIAGSQEEDIVAGTQPWQAKMREYAAGCGDGILIGTGPSVESVRELGQSYGIATRAAVAGRRLRGCGVFFHDEFLVFAHMLSGADTPEHSFLIDRVLGPLLTADGPGDNSLMATLEAALFAPGLDAVAGTLGVHINTIRYRMNKIQALTGHDFTHPAGRFTLTSACLLHILSDPPSRRRES